MTVVCGHGHEEYSKVFSKGLIPVGAGVVIGDRSDGCLLAYTSLVDGNLQFIGISYTPENAINGKLWRVDLSKKLPT